MDRLPNGKIRSTSFAYYRGTGPFHGAWRCAAAMMMMSHLRMEFCLDPAGTYSASQMVIYIQLQFFFFFFSPLPRSFSNPAAFTNPILFSVLFLSIFPAIYKVDNIRTHPLIAKRGSSARIHQRHTNTRESRAAVCDIETWRCLINRNGRTYYTKSIWNLGWDSMKRKEKKKEEKTKNPSPQKNSKSIRSGSRSAAAGAA